MTTNLILLKPHKGYTDYIRYEKYWRAENEKINIHNIFERSVLFLGNTAHELVRMNISDK